MSASILCYDVTVSCCDNVSYYYCLVTTSLSQLIVSGKAEADKAEDRAIGARENNKTLGQAFYKQYTYT